MSSELSLSIEKKVFELILASPNVKIKTVDAEMDLEAIKMDSLETLSMAMDLEDTFSIEITDEELGEFKKVSDVLVYMDAKLQSKQDGAITQADIG